MSTTSPGARLAAARLDSGMSLEDVAAATKLRASIVAAIEVDDFSVCGGAVYARGHVRTIAQVVGLDPDSLMSDLDVIFGQGS